MPMTRSILVASFSLFAVHSAYAASSDWHHVQGGSVRIVTSGTPDTEGRVRGALQIDLKKGWKTYWLDPGSSGVPPQLSVTVGDEAATVEIDFPAPQRFDDGYALWAGYDAPVTLALTLRLPVGSDAPARVDASTFLGVCETICIPVQAKLTFDPYADTHDPADAQIVDAAFAALPEAERDGLAAVAIEVEQEALTVEAVVPQGVEAMDLFVASADGLTLGVPERTGMGENGILFKLPVVRRSKGAPTQVELPYTLITSTGAVSGKLTVH